MEFKDISPEAWAGGAITVSILLVIAPLFIRWIKQNRAINAALDGNGAYAEGPRGLQIMQRRGGKIITTSAE